MSDKNCNIACVIMASGEGKRFGGNKLISDFDGKPLIEHAIDTATSVFDNVVVVTRHKDVQALCENKNIDVILHSFPGRNDTVRLGLEKICNCKNIDGCIFCQGDQPLLSAETLQNMISEFNTSKDKIVRLQFDSAPSSPTLFPRWAFNALLNLPQGKGGNLVVKDNLEKVIYVTAQNRYEIVDIDTKEDLENLKSHI